MSPINWRFTTEVLEPSHDIARGTRGDYELTLQPLGGCQFRLELRRVRDVRPDGRVHLYRPPAALPEALIVQAREHDGSGLIDVRARLDSSRGRASPYQHAFYFTIRDGQVDGAFVASSQSGTYSGTISGQRAFR